MSFCVKSHLNYKDQDLGKDPLVCVKRDLSESMSGIKVLFIHSQNSPHVYAVIKQ